MNKYEKLLRYLRKENGSISFSIDYKNKNLITINIKERIIMVVNKMSEVLEKLEKELKRIK